MPMKARSLRACSPADDPSSLDAILKTMGVITHDELARAIRLQQESSPEEQLGHILVSLGLCTQDQVHNALQAQNGMRSMDKNKQAMAVASLAEQLRNRTIAESHRIVERGKDRKSVV